MATIPGGLFDPSANPNVSVKAADLISSVLTRLGLSETSTQQIQTGDSRDVVVESTDGTVFGSVVFEPGKSVVIPTDDGTNFNFGVTDTVSGGSNQVAITFGGGSDSIIGGLGDDLVTGGSGNDVVTGLDIQALTIEGVVIEAGADSLTGGGAAISDAQRNYYLNIATKFGAGAQKLAEMDKAIQILSETGDDLASNLLTYYLRVAAGNQPAAGTELKLDAGTSPKDVMLTMRLADIPGVTMVFSNMEKLLLLGEGAARIDDPDGAIIIGDSSRQVFAGGSGADTLVGGGGQDTLVGGGGADVFGLIKRGHVTINDFVVGTDKLAFDFDGVSSKADVAKYLTSVENLDGNTRFYFGSDASITLVGVTATGLFDDMLFNIS